MSLLAVAGTNSAVAGGYDIANSLKMEGAPTDEEMYQTLGTPTSTKIMTFSFWTKRTGLATGNEYLFCTDQQVSSPNNTFRIFFEGDTQFCVQNYSATVQNTRLVTPDYFRDTSAWYHFVVAIDTTQATASNRMKLYINGVYKSSYVSGIETQPGQNEDIYLESGRVLRVGAWKQDSGTVYRVGQRYLSEVHFVDGQQLTASDFGEFDTDTGIWKPKAYTGSYGNNGFYLDFENSASLGADGSGNSNNFTLSNITSVDQATDTPTNNFATWNVIEDSRNPADSDRIYFNEGGTQPIKSFGTGWTCVTSTQAVSNGKWYWEGEVERQDGATMWGCFPVRTKSANSFGDFYIGGSETNGYDSGCAFYDNDDAYYYDNTSTACTISGGTIQTVAGDIIMIAIDMDNNKFYAGRNGQWFNSTDNTHANATGITLSDEEHFFAFAAYHPSRTYKTNLGGYTTISIASGNSDANGYGNFEYAPPSGYYALCSKNLAEFG